MTGKAGLVVVCLVLVALLVGSLYYGFVSLGVIQSNSTSGTIQISGKGSPVNPGVYGVNVRSIDQEPANAQSLLSSTPITYLRYPGGIVGERMDMSTNMVYNYGGGSFTATFTTQAFVQLCLSINCRAIIQLPLEINSPSTGAMEVSYVENTLGFRPAYWELGNEPGGYPCFGVAWSNWGNACSGGTNPNQFAQVTKAYISAVRNVDPTAQFVGLGGTGLGSGQNVPWITPMEQVNGPNLAAISIHSYVDGSGPPLATLSGFFSGLSSTNALPNILLQARGAITSACSTCSTQVFVTEMGSANGGGSYGQYIGTFYDALFLAAEITQGLNFQASNVDAFSWNQASAGFTNGPGIGPKEILYSNVLNLLGPNQFNATVPGATNVYVGATESTGFTQLLLINTNTGSTANIVLSGSGLPKGESATLWTWNPSQPVPVQSTTNTNATLSIPSTSLALVIAAGVCTGCQPFQSPPPTPVPTVFGVPLGWIEAGVLLLAAGLSAFFLRGWWRLVSVPLAIGAVVLLLYSVTVVGS